MKSNEVPAPGLPLSGAGSAGTTTSSYFDLYLSSWIFDLRSTTLVGITEIDAVWM
jgi:hypothetical protein